MRTLLLPADVAKMIGRMPSTVRWLEASGQLTASAKTPGGVRLFGPADVERFIALREKRGLGPVPRTD